ncbi:MAG: P1 family peptidase [Granulosicoccus sp.]
MNANLDRQRWHPGKRNLITDVPGLKVGNAADERIKSGVTVLTADTPFIASVDVMGGAPGTRETDCLAPDRLVSQVDALVLSGGSAFGLDAASGVVDALRDQKRGFAVGPVNIPIVPAAIIFDLINGGAVDWKSNPYSGLGRQAFDNASPVFEQGTTGAGSGATTAALKGGLGSASLQLPDGTTVGALVVVNPHGHVVIPETRHFWAAPYEMGGEFGALGLPDIFDPYTLPQNEKFRAYEAATGARLADDPSPAGLNTTIAVVATDLSLDKAQLKRMAVAAQDGLARAISPSHTLFDGDLIFAVSTAGREPANQPTDTLLIGHAAAVCLSRAIARGVFHAQSRAGDTLPSWQSLYSNP